jgi:hypothetical protein
LNAGKLSVEPCSGALTPPCVELVPVPCDPSPSIGALARSAIALPRSGSAHVVVAEWLPSAALLTAALLGPGDPSVLLPESLVVVVVPLGGDAHEVVEVVVEGLVVSVVDLVAVGDGPMSLLPDPSVGELLSLLSGFLPADVLAALVDPSSGGCHAIDSTGKNAWSRGP